jgi:hypothetical protein
MQMEERELISSINTHSSSEVGEKSLVSGIRADRERAVI